MHTRTVIAALAAADLPDSTLRVAVRLLTNAHPETGTTTLDWSDYLAISNGTNRPAARRHLSRLSAAGLLHYSTNKLIYIQFAAWIGVPNRYADDTKSVSPTYQSGITYPEGRNDTAYQIGIKPGDLIPNRYADDTGLARIRANPPLTPPMSVCLSNPILLPETDKQCTDNSAQTIALLTDPEIGIDPETAAKLATEHEYDWVQRQVAIWWTQVQHNKSTGTGGLLNRLARGWTGPFPKSFKKTDLYRRHWPAEPTTADKWTDYLSRGEATP